MIKVDVVKEIGWEDKVWADIEVGLKDAMAVTTLERAKAATDIARKRSRPGPHRKMMEITELTIFPYSEGWTSGLEGGITSPAWYAWFQSDGTLASRKKPVKKATLERRSSLSGKARYAKVAGNKGITPLEFFDAAIKVGRAELKKQVKLLG